MLCFSESGFFKKNSHPIKFKTIHVMFPPSPNSMLYSELCVWRPSKKQPFLFIVFGTSKHNIEVGGYGGNVCIYGASCGWLFFLKNPGRVFWLKKTGNNKILPDSEKHRKVPAGMKIYIFHSKTGVELETSNPAL